MIEILCDSTLEEVETKVKELSGESDLNSGLFHLEWLESEVSYCVEEFCISKYTYNEDTIDASEENLVEKYT